MHDFPSCSHRLGSWLLAILFSFFVIPSHSFAQIPPRKRDSGVQNLLKIAEKLYVEGIRLAQKKKFEQALAKFRASYRIVPLADEPQNNRIRGTLHLLIGRTYHRMKQWSKARDHYRKYLKVLTKDRRRVKVESWLKQIRPHLMAKIQIQMTPEGQCSITFPGGSWRGSVPALVTVESGKIRMKCSGHLHKSTALTFTIEPKQKLTKTIQLLHLPKPPQDLSWIGLVVGGLGVATIGTGAVMGGLALGDQSTALQVLDNATDGNETTNAWDIHRSGEQKAAMANVLYISGGGLAIVGVILYFVLRPRSVPAKRVQLVATQNRVVCSTNGKGSEQNSLPQIGCPASITSRSWQGTGKSQRPPSKERGLKKPVLTRSSPLGRR